MPFCPKVRLSFHISILRKWSCLSRVAPQCSRNCTMRSVARRLRPVARRLPSLRHRHGAAEGEDEAGDDEALASARLQEWLNNSLRSGHVTLASELLIRSHVGFASAEGLRKPGQTGNNTVPLMWSDL